MKRKTLYLVIVVLTFFMLIQPKNTVYLDSGHSTSLKGAMGINFYEIIYNDKLVEKITEQFRIQNKFNLFLTRNSGKNVKVFEKKPEYMNFLTNEQWSSNLFVRDLYSRAHIANLNKADVFISIHHDSTTEDYLLPEYSKVKNRDTNKEFKDKFQPGFSIFVSSYNNSIQNNDPKINTRFKNSIKLAQFIAKGLIKMGRAPSTYHHEERSDNKQGYVLLNEQLGIYDSRFAVLKATKMPSVLIEAGVIVDKNDEQKVNLESFRVDFSVVLERSLDKYFQSLDK